MSIDNTLPSYTTLREPTLEFHPDLNTDRHVHPLQGLAKFGPYSRSYGWPNDPVRIGAVFPKGWLPRIQGLVEELDDRHEPVERPDYLTTYPGFTSVFGIRAVLDAGSSVEMPEALNAELRTHETPYLFLSEQLARAVGTLRANRSNIDVVLIAIPDNWNIALSDSDSGKHGLHDHLKRVAAQNGIPIQIVRESGALTYKCRCSVMWHLSIAIYCKAGGIPWKLRALNPDTVYIGVAYSLRPSTSNKKPFVVCASQVFDSDGTGLEFVAFETNRVADMDGENPFLNHGDMLRLVSRSLSLYQRRHGGHLPARVVVHKSTRFTSDEIDGSFDAIQDRCEVDLLHIQQDVLWLGTKWAREFGKVGATSFPVDRGTLLQLGQFETLLWTQGDTSSIAPSGRHFYKEGSGIPNPICIHRYAGHGDFTQSCSDILGLTKMDWNNDALYDRLPVTIKYAQVAARTLKHGSLKATRETREYSFKYFM